MSLTSWYNVQYSTWNRTRRLHTTPYLARTGSHTSQVATAMAQASAAAAAVAPVVDASKDGGKKSSEPLFGPSIGSVSSGPAWTFSSEKKVVTDELTPDIVSAWIERSKEPSQPTTTLQALVNLKRPTLRLSPLTAVHEHEHDDAGTPIPASDQHHHGLEFEYDCDAPKCGIYVHVYLPKTHPDAPASAAHHPLAKLLVFESVVDGGFGNHLKLEEGAMLELGRFSDPHGHEASSSSTDATSAPLPTVAEASSSGDLAAATPSADPARPSTSGAHNQHQRRRFTNFHFRKRSHNHSISGPALAVVDAEPAAAQEAGKTTKDAKDDAEEGVRVTIRLAALDEQGTELASPNEQITYLHIVRFGQKAAPVEGGAEGAEAAAGEDTRPWVVKVVKREATIGPHTFHLHEIFGLTAASSHTHPPTAPPPILNTAHTYPPEENTEAPSLAQQADDEEPQSECLLCLSSPREVVLLPCRHLVACKECALNMVEFGAGGNITQAPEPVVGAGGDDAAGAGATGAAAGGAPATPATPAAPANPRRKRKAKGWFCPVCRQPYTSMLRLTTTQPPTLPSSKDAEGSGSGTEDEVAVPEPAHTNANGGLLGGTLRPGFLRGLSSLRGSAQAAPGDVENQNAVVRPSA